MGNGRISRSPPCSEVKHLSPAEGASLEGTRADLVGQRTSRFQHQQGNLRNLIPVTLSACTTLEHLHLQGNSFSGSLHLSLKTLKNIKELDLSRNNLSGQIPEYLENLFVLKPVLQSLRGLCGDLEELHLPSCHFARPRITRITLLKVVIPVAVILMILLACLIIVYTGRRKHTQKSSRTLPMEQHFPMVSYAELNKATNDF
ncbi:hypothetical protein CUMW_257010 [Citrus unshiu]|uniref:Leucine-rich repeat-containing N-terminal plant-type domain-containing protein n=1 Tax=Citrus unshiu TaxID=55188 RepID=A0A2H5QSE2_CITUN|nr:hypothetical protein CUMW_257010 [Citrus unshiu]